MYIYVEVYRYGGRSRMETGFHHVPIMVPEVLALLEPSRGGGEFLHPDFWPARLTAPTFDIQLDPRFR